MRAYVELGSRPDGSESVRAWTFDLARWGVSASADTIPGALALLQQATDASAIELEEVVESHDPAFSRDLEPAGPGERAATMTILEQSRAATLALLRDADEWRVTRPAAESPHVDAEGWESAGLLALSFADTESRRYPEALGLPTREPVDGLVDELAASHRFAMKLVADLPDVLITATPDGGEWTSVKLLRMLAWRERAHLGLLRALLEA